MDVCRTAPLLLVGVALATAGSAQQPSDWQPPNLVRNPGFEEAGPDGAAVDWDAYTTSAADPHSGQRALTYENSDPHAYILSSQDIPLQVGKAYEVSVWVRTEGVEGPESGATICLEWYDADGKWLGGHYPEGVKGTSGWQQLRSRSGRIPEGAAGCHVTCYLRPGMTGKAWWDDVEVRQWRQPLLQTLLLEPNYRGEVTSQTKALELSAQLDVQDWDVGLGDLLLQANLVRRRDGAVVRTREVEPAAVETMVRLPARGLEPGPYELQVAAVRRGGGAELAADAWPVRVLARDQQRGRKSYVDEHNRLIRDGEPFLPLGMYWGEINGADLRIYADSPFNCLMPYAAPTQEQMNLAEASGLKVIYTVKDIYHGSQWAPEGINTIGAERAWIEDKAQRFRDHPALLAWYLNDELPVEYMERLNAHQQWLEELDPNHPTWVVLWQVGEVRQYARSFDAIGTDPYPIPEESARRAGTWARMTVEAVCDRRPVWMVPQVFDWACYRETEEAKRGLRPPTLAEMRSMTWQCIAEGARGLVYYSFFDIKRDTVVPFDVQWPLVKQVAAEVRDLIPVILSVEPVPAISVEERAWLHWTTRRLGATVYLIAVNDEGYAHHVVFRLPAVPAHLRLRGGDEVTPPADGRLRVQLEPHGVAIYGMRF